MRIALGVEYDGSGFCGWQRQVSQRTVQGCVEEALSCVANHAVHVSCAGRTDTGVHALGQVVHFDTDSEREMSSWVLGANANLPKTISVIWAQPVSDEFHARYSVTSRHYRYVIYSRPIRPAVLETRVSWDYRSLDEARMVEAASYLVGEHDFSSYRASQCQSKSPVRNVMRLDVNRQGDFIILDIEANAFLHHMVRNIAGVLMEIGAGEQEPIWAQQVLHFRDRALGGVTARPQGLYFLAVKYPEAFQIPRLSSATLVW